MNRPISILTAKWRDRDGCENTLDVTPIGGKYYVLVNGYKVFTADTMTGWGLFVSGFLKGLKQAGLEVAE